MPAPTDFVVQDLQRYQALLRSFMVVADRFMQATPMEWEVNVLNVFKELGLVLHALRIYAVKLTQPVGEKPRGFLRYEWKDTGEQAVFSENPEHVQSLVDLGFDPWLVHLRRGEVVCSRKGDGVVDEVSWNIHSSMRTLILLPVFVGPAWWGYIGIEDAVDRSSSNEELDALRAVAATFGSAIQRKRIDEELIALKLGIERSDDVIFTTNRDGVFKYINPSFTLLYGYDPKEVVGITPRILKSGKHDPDFYRRFWDTLCAGSVVSTQMTNRRKDGSLVVMRITASPIIDEHKKIIGFMAIQRDVTEEDQIRRTLAEKTELLDNIITTIPDCVFWKDKQSVYIGCNQQFAVMTGFASPQHVVGKTDFDMPWTKEEAAKYRQDDQTVMTSGQPMLHIIEAQRSVTGVEKTVETDKVPIRDKQGMVVGVLGVNRDITERIKTERALLDRSHELERLNKLMVGRELKMVELKQQLKRQPEEGK